MKKLKNYNGLGGIALLLLLTLSFGVSASKIKISSSAELPRAKYEIKGKASELLTSDEATFQKFLKPVEVNLDKLLSDYEIPDKSTLRGLLGAKSAILQLNRDYKGSLEILEKVRTLQEKPASKLMSGIRTRARLKAAIQTGKSSGPAFEKALIGNYTKAVNALPWEIVQDRIKGYYTGSLIVSRAVFIGSIMTQLDPVVKNSGGLDNPQAWGLIATRLVLRDSLPLQPIFSKIEKAYIDAHEVPKPDVWAEREVTLKDNQKLTPVPIAIWDSGIDISLFPSQLFTNKDPSVGGRHGIALYDDGKQGRSWLQPLTKEERDAYPDFVQEIKGRNDLFNGIDSQAAKDFQEKMRAYTPEQYLESQKMAPTLGNYVHGTHCAGIAVHGNPFARLVVMGFNDSLAHLPFAPTEKWVKSMAASFMAMSKFYNKNNVRVVNASWGGGVDEFEQWLSRSGGRLSAKERNARATQLFTLWKKAIKNAIESAPNTLFITAAGNSDSDAGFDDHVPGSLNLPNLISVGAVDQAGSETSFTSSGKNVLVHANGYQVESYIPGGKRVKLSGTSMASPNVANLAAKLLALDPRLTVAETIDLILKGSTRDSNNRVNLIHPKRSVELLAKKLKARCNHSAAYLKSN